MPPACNSTLALATGAGLAASAALVRPWDEWLTSHHEHDEEFEREDGRGTLTLGSCRPTTLGQLARGAGSCLAFLAACDALIARRARDDTARYFVLHTLANWVITVSSSGEMASVLGDPVNLSLGKCNLLPTYMTPCLFGYHLSVFKNVPAEEWQHHIIFGLGLAGPGRRCC